MNDFKSLWCPVGLFSISKLLSHKKKQRRSFPINYFRQKKHSLVRRLWCRWFILNKLPSPGTQGRTDKNLCRCFGAPACRVFPDHLIITNILMHRLGDTQRHAHTIARLTWEQTAGGTVRTVRSTRGDTGTRTGPNGAIGGFDRRLDPRIGPLHRETAWLGVGLRAD